MTARWTPITKEQTAEFDVLSCMNDGAATGVHKFAVELGLVLETYQQAALERLMGRDWIYLLDVSPLPLRGSGPTLFRIFGVRPVAVAWYESRRDQEHERQA